MAGQLPKIKNIYNSREQKFFVPKHLRVEVDLESDTFEVPQEPAILWSLHWQTFSQNRILAFVEKLLEPLRAKSVGVIIDHTKMGQERPWRELLALLPEEVPAFLSLEGDQLEQFPFELLDYLHIIWESRYSSMLPVLDQKLSYAPSRKLAKALLLPPKGESFELVDQALQERLIAEERLIYDWDGVDELTILPQTLSPQGARMVQGFAATGGTVIEFRDGSSRPQPLGT
ncbi:MAG: hypothetical protein K0U13_02300 [Chlamydiae bacterium]|nr:hypothetical protein [Chlamydiota bacterium]